MVKADLYQLEGLADVAREKLVEAAHLSDDPIIQLGLAEIDLELERYQEAIQEYAQLDNQEILEATEFPPINGLVLPMPILVSLKQLFPS